MFIIANHKFMKPVYLFTYIIVLLSLAGCRTKQDLSYMYDISTSPEGEIPRSSFRITLQPDDELAIAVTSAVPEVTAEYNRSILPENMKTFVINSEGDINLPVLGRLHVAGMTTEQVRKMLTEKIEKEVKDPTVTVRLVNFKVNVIGEVRGPRSINVTTERFSLLDALAAAGDLSEYGNRENVTVLRELPDGQISYCHLNLRDSKITQSPYFYLQQNDVVIVEPNDIKQANSKYNQNNAYKLSLTSTIVSAASIIASLIIALTVK